MEFGPNTISALADLIAPKEDSDSEDDMVRKHNEVIQNAVVIRIFRLRYDMSPFPKA